MSREIDADIAGMDGEDMVDEIMTLRIQIKALRERMALLDEKEPDLADAFRRGWEAGNDAQEFMEQQINALKEQIGRLQVEREEMKRTYDKALERVNREALNAERPGVIEGVGTIVNYTIKNERDKEQK